MTNKELFQSYIENIKQDNMVNEADKVRKLKLVEDWKNKMYLDFGFLTDIGFTMRFVTTHGHRYDACIISICRENDGWNYQYDGYVFVHDFDDFDIETIKGMNLIDWNALSIYPDYINAEFDNLDRIGNYTKVISKENLIKQFAAWYTKNEH